MCKFLSSLSKHSNDIIGSQKRNVNLEMFLKPCKDAKTYYRVRLLAFSSNSGRTDPHITRIVHSAWTTDPATGKRRQMKLVCPAKTPWVDVEGDKNSSCKICAWENQQWAIYNESGKTDKNAVAKANSVRKSFEAIVPVYVVTDPNYERNMGKMKVIIFNDKKEYEHLRKLIEAKSREVRVFNGKDAVDLVLHVSSEPIQTKNGYTFNKTVIDKMVFSTNPHDIPAINEKTIDSFPFDETYYSSPLDEDIDEFYEKFCAISNDDIPDDDDIPVYKPETNKTSEQKASIPANDVKVDEDISDSDLDDIIDQPSKPVDDSLKTDPDDLGLDDVPASAPASSADKDAKDAGDILAELGL